MSPRTPRSNGGRRSRENRLSTGFSPAFDNGFTPCFNTGVFPTFNTGVGTGTATPNFNTPATNFSNGTFNNTPFVNGATGNYPFLAYAFNPYFGINTPINNGGINPGTPNGVNTETQNVQAA